MADNVVKVFPLTSCQRCPNKITVTQTFEPIRVTACYGSNMRVLPYKISLGITGTKYADPTYVMPDWCPLEDLKA